ncbi:hypothetical protein GC098_17450 [Paenibacillus sp. LMG 31458]|uniref:Glycosyl hydrolases family 38 C-terminal domain-containing protein n=2 Tax=Paenibacillus phytorum TaxID=2654977 RepID=A0ABX1XX88_9BACL|nr:hypothetical protein [Paenibacillus phytorum]
MEDVSVQFIEISGSGVQIFDIKPAEEGNIVRLSNCTDQLVATQLHFPSRKIEAVFKTNVLEVKQMEMNININGSLELNLEANQILLLLMILE